MATTDNGTQPILQTEHLTRTVEETQLVDDISIAVQQGELLAIIGPSGAGKSSFLRLLNRLDEPTAGTVYLDGQDYRTIPPHALRRRVGMVMQAPYLFPGTVTANLRYGPAQRGETLTADTVEQLLNRVGLAGYGDREISRLSGGEAQRVSLARTLANN
ncbi:MAG: ATP-binding cassette domain-containing protein, partial [Caldilineaceae bacterium]|nr:ATP-binding cassette domain-containing protein [Caldilineaceae bacterium]